MISQYRLKLGKFYCIGVKKEVDKCIKMSYYQFNIQEILQKGKERYSKEKAAEYYSKNKEAIKENSKM